MASRAFAEGRARRIALWLHRYVGLAMTVFLLVAGLTGALLAFYPELDRALNPELLAVEPPSADAQPLEPFELQRRVQQSLGASQPFQQVVFDAKPGEAITAWIQLAGTRGPEGEEQWRQVFVDPYTGKVLGLRDWGNLSEGFGKNLMPFIYRLHYSLALGEVGTLLFGIVALLWTVDCFVGAYLTFPAARRRDAQTRGSFFARWLPAWKVRTTKMFSFVFTWHRASGLWVWAMLLVFAWSGVAINLPQAYEPVMKTLAGFEKRAHDRLPQLQAPYPEPKLSLAEAHAIGQRLMAAEAEQRGFSVVRELRLALYRDHGAFSYEVESSLDISERHPRTEVYFDAQTGAPMGFDAPTGISAGNTITSWLFGLHFAAVGGTWYRVFVLVMGLAVAALSVTGFWIWLRKRSKRAAPSPARAALVVEVG